MSKISPDFVIQTALKSDLSKKYCAIILHRNKIMSIGYNYSTYNSSIKSEFERNKYCIHAERSAIINYIKQYGLKHISDCKILIFKLDNDQVALAKPCSACCLLIKKYNFIV
jgi:cytidine deaminase